MPPGRLRNLSVFALFPALSAANALVGLLLPMLLGVADFGTYSLVVTLFQYGLIFDFGLAQLVDRRVPVFIAEGRRTELARFVSVVLWLRLYIAGAVLAAGCALLLGLAAWGGLPFDPVSGALSLAAGLCFMVALGPAAVYRASLDRRTFALVNAALSAVLVVARPAGVLLDGVTGCFVALALSYGLLAATVQARMPPLAAHRPSAVRAACLLGEGLPLFAVSLTWAFYMTANRWVVSLLASPEELGRFAFGSNIVYLIVGTVGALSQFYYPKAATRFAAEGAFSTSRMIMRDFCRLALLMAALSAAGIVLAPTLIDLLYHRYGDAVPAIQVLLAAVPSLVVTAWLMPLSLSTATRPWIEGAIVYPASLAILVLATAAGHMHAGSTGAAYGLVASAIPLLALQLCALRNTRVVTWAAAAALFAAVGAATGFLLVLASA